MIPREQVSSAKKFGLGLLLLSCLSTRSDAGETELDRVHGFLQRAMVGRSVECHKVTTIAGGRIETEYTNRISFCSLSRSERRATILGFWQVKQSNHDLDHAGQRRPGAPTVKDRIGLTEYTFDLSQSTGKVLGSSRVVALSSDEWPGLPSRSRVTLAGDRLEVKTMGTLYGDFFAPGGAYYPGISDSEDVWQLRSGRLTRTIHSASYEVDPVTLQRTKPTGETTAEYVESPRP